MKLSEISTKEFEKLKKEAEEKRFLRLLKNVLRPCKECSIRNECFVPVKDIPR